LDGIRCIEMAIIGDNRTPSGSVTSYAPQYCYIVAACPVTIAAAKFAQTTTAWIYGADLGLGNLIKVGIYRVGATDAETVLVAQTQITVTAVWGWNSAAISAALEAGETYIVAAIGNGTGRKSGPVTANKKKTGITDFTLPDTLVDAIGDNWFVGCYVEYIEFDETDYSADLSGSFPMLVQVEPHPVLTDGRSPTHSEGHEPKYALNGNLNTYWEPEDRSDDSLWFDLGEATPVYAIVLWLYNYNESWGSPKSWQVAYSLDDITYYTFSEKLFDDYRDTEAPILVDILPNSLSARYWRVTFKNFDGYPQTVPVKVSAIWFVKPYYMPQRRTLPATDTHKYSMETTQDAMDRELTRQASYGRQIAMPVKLLLTSQDDADRIAAMYEAARHGARPIVCKPRQDDETWRLMRISNFSLARSEHDLWLIDFTLEDVGHKLIPRYNMSNSLHPETVGVWDFNETLNDESGCGNHLAGYQVGPENYVHGINRYVKTALTIYDGDIHIGYIDPPDCNDFDMGTDDFTVEMMLLLSAGGGNSLYMRKHTSGVPESGWKSEGIDVGGNVYFYVSLGDGVNEVIHSGAAGKPISDNEWHYIAFTVDRTTGLLKIYIDAVQYGGDFDISAITGDISAPAKTFYVQAGGNANTAYDFAGVTRRAFTQAEIAERMAGSLSYGIWRI